MAHTLEARSQERERARHRDKWIIAGALLTQYQTDPNTGNMPANNTTNGVSSVTHQWPHDVGILAMDIYFPHQFVDQVRYKLYDLHLYMINI